MQSYQQVTESNRSTARNAASAFWSAVVRLRGVLRKRSFASARTVVTSASVFACDLTVCVQRRAPRSRLLPLLVTVKIPFALDRARSTGRHCTTFEGLPDDKVVTVEPWDPEAGGDPALCSAFDVYVFQWYSDHLPIASERSTLGLSAGLEKWLLQGLSRRPVVFLAYSSGGLIVRGFLKKASPHRSRNVLRLIALATPHHETPLANERARDGIISGTPLNYPAVAWRHVADVGDVKGLDAPRLPIRGSTEPNRAELRWDNYDGRIAANIYDAPTEIGKARNVGACDDS